MFDAVYCFYQHGGKGALRYFDGQAFGPYEALRPCTRAYTERIQRIQEIYNALVNSLLFITNNAITIQLPLR